jgi:hypothetical protein
MRAVVVYESMYGNTHEIADAIGAGLETSFDVTVVPVAEAGPAMLADAGLVVVGGPTHVHGMSRAATRRAAGEAAAKPDSDVTLEPGALGLGLREWFGSLGRYPVKAAAFDTPAARAVRADRPGRQGGDPAAPGTWVRRGHEAGELPGHDAEHARSGGDHPGT